MQQADKREFKDLMTDALAFYRRDVSTFALGVWWAACQPFDLEQIRKALTAHATDPERGQFAPTPADIVRQLRGTFTDRSLVAWGKVLEAIQRVGAYQSVVFDDPAIHCAIEDIGGWMAVCRSDLDELPHLQRRFIESHRVYLKRPGHAYPHKLVGAHEIENAVSGHKAQAPVLIGCPNAARAVFEGGMDTPRIRITSAAQALPAIAHGKAAA